MIKSLDQILTDKGQSIEIFRAGRGLRKSAMFLYIVK